VQIQAAPQTNGLDKLRYECSPDNGATWPATVDGAADGTPARVTGLDNGVDYRCRAFAENPIGVSGFMKFVMAELPPISGQSMSYPSRGPGTPDQKPRICEMGG